MYVCVLCACLVLEEIWRHHSFGIGIIDIENHFLWVLGNEPRFSARAISIQPLCHLYSPQMHALKYNFMEIQFKYYNRKLSSNLSSFLSFNNEVSFCWGVSYSSFWLCLVTTYWVQEKQIQVSFKANVCENHLLSWSINRVKAVSLPVKLWIGISLLWLFCLLTILIELCSI